MYRFDTATTSVLHGIAELGAAHVTLFGDRESFDATHYGLGRITRDDLAGRYVSLLVAADVTAADFPASAYWIVSEDGTGFVYASSFGDEADYLSGLSVLTAEPAAHRSAV